MQKKPWYRQKTTLTGLGAIIIAAAGFAAGGMGLVPALQIAIPGLIGVFLRQGVENVKPVAALLLIPTLMLMPACATLQTQDIPPPGCEDSLIYTYMPSPKAVDTLLTVAVYNFAEEVGGAKPLLLKAIDKIDAALLPVEQGTGSMNGMDFVLMINEEVGVLNAKIGNNILIISEALVDIQVPVPLTQCDAQLIRTHLAKERKWVSIARPGE
jgi:hypothetical protein